MGETSVIEQLLAETDTRFPQWIDTHPHKDHTKPQIHTHLLSKRQILSESPQKKNKNQDEKYSYRLQTFEKERYNFTDKEIYGVVPFEKDGVSVDILVGAKPLIFQETKFESNKLNNVITRYGGKLQQNLVEAIKSSRAAYHNDVDYLLHTVGLFVDNIDNKFFYHPISRDDLLQELFTGEKQFHYVRHKRDKRLEMEKLKPRLKKHYLMPQRNGEKTISKVQVVPFNQFNEHISQRDGIRYGTYFPVWNDELSMSIPYFIAQDRDRIGTYNYGIFLKKFQEGVKIIPATINVYRDHSDDAYITMVEATKHINKKLNLDAKPMTLIGGRGTQDPYYSIGRTDETFQRTKTL